MTQPDHAALQAKYDLSYHVPYAFEAEARVGLQGKSVLEVGGGLPRGFVLDELKAQRWIGLEEFDYYAQIDLPAANQPTGRLEDVASVEALGSHAVLSGRIERLPPVFHGQFDRVFSIAAFEHIDRIPQALDCMYDALKPGGIVFSMFSPIWSALDGHHLHNVVDATGQVLNFHKSPVPPWGHLLFTPPQMHAYLLQHTDRRTAGEIVYEIYNSPGINRLSTEDYVAYFEASRFSVKTLTATFPTPIPAELQAALEARRPGYKHFENNGLLVVLEKAA